MYVTEFHQDDRKKWDEFVLQSAGALPFHLSGWKAVMQHCYHFPFWRLAAVEKNRIEGVLPLIKVSSKLFGTSVRSLPGGICAENPAARRALLEYAKNLARDARADYLMIQDERCAWQGENAWRSECTFSSCEVPKNNVVLLHGLKRQVRQHIHKAESCGVSTCTSSDDMDEFYSAYCDLMHEKGIPVFGRAFIEAIVNEFENQSVFVTAHLNDQVIGAIFLFLLRDTVYAVWGGAPSRYHGVGASYALWWQVMKFAVDHGYCLVDMGRSPCGSGSEVFKSRWGCTPHPVYDLCVPLKKQRTVNAVSGSFGGSRYQIFTKLWRFLPNNLAEFIGPQLRRHVPFG